MEKFYRSGLAIHLARAVGERTEVLSLDHGLKCDNIASWEDLVISGQDFYSTLEKFHQARHVRMILREYYPALMSH